MPDGRMIRNTTRAEPKVGDTARLERTCTEHDLFLFGHTSGNLDPPMLPSQRGGDDPAVIAPSM